MTGKPPNLVVSYIYLAVASGVMGVAMTLLVLFVCQYLGIDVYENLWVLAIPLALSIFLNVCLVELYRRFHKG